MYIFSNSKYGKIVTIIITILRRKNGVKQFFVFNYLFVIDTNSFLNTSPGITSQLVDTST